MRLDNQSVYPRGISEFYENTCHTHLNRIQEDFYLKVCSSSCLSAGPDIDVMGGCNPITLVLSQYRCTLNIILTLKLQGGVSQPQIMGDMCNYMC